MQRRGGWRCAALAVTVAVVAGGCLDAPPVGVADDVPGWQRRARLTFGNSMRAPLFDIPVLVNLDDSLRSDLGLSDDLHDLRFLDSDGETMLPYQVIASLNQDGTTPIWVKVPRVDMTDEDFIWILGDNRDAAPPDSSQAASVWTGYLGVWHLEEGDGVYADSTGRGGDGMASDTPSSQSGISGRGVHLAGQQIQIMPEIESEPEALGLEIWVKLDDVDLADQEAMNSDQFILVADRVDASGCAVSFHGSDDVWSEYVTGQTLTIAGWRFLSASFERQGATGRVSLLLEGAEEGSLETSFVSLSASSSPITIGNALVGIVDEVRVTTTPHDIYWLWASTEMGFGNEAENPFVDYGPAEDL